MKTVFAVAVLAAYASAKKEPKAKDCKPEDWKFKCNELVPEFDKDCVVKYSFDPCDDFGESDVCRMHMDKKDKEGQDCIPMLQDPETWGQIMYSDLWFQSEPIAYDVWWRWDAYHAEMDDQEVSWDEDMAWDQDMNMDWDGDMAWDEDMNMDWDEDMTWDEDMNMDWDEDMTWDEDMNMDWDEDMTWDQETDMDMDWDCQLEKWAKPCSEFDPSAPSDCEIVYEHDPCGASSCVIWDEYGPSDCLEGLQDPDFWVAIKDLEVWDESNQLTKAYWDEYHAAANGGEDGVDEEAWYEDDYDYDYEEDVWEDFDYLYDDWEDYDDECDWEAGAYWEEPCASFDPEAGEDCYVYYTAPVCGMAPSCWIEENGEWDDCLWMLADKETWDVLSQSGGFTTEEMAETWQYWDNYHTGEYDEDAAEYAWLNGHDWYGGYEEDFDQDGCLETCDFYECDAEDQMFGEGTCWEELCYDECSWYIESCEQWHAVGEDADGEIEWVGNPCPWLEDWENEEDWEDMDDWEDRMTPEEFQQNALDAADFMITNFNGTATEAFNAWCRDGNCLNPVAEMAGVNIDQTIDTLSKALNNNSTNAVVSQFAQDLTNTFGEDFSPLQSLTEMDHKERKQVVNEAINQVAQELASEDWLSGLLGVFSEGKKNDGLERKGDRRN